MPNSRWIRTIISLAAGIMFGLSALSGDSIDEQGLRWLGITISAVTLALFAFDRWAFRWWGIRTLTELGGVPVIHGTWRGTLDYERDGDGQPGQMPIYLAVCQTYSTVTVRCFFPATSSESITLLAAIRKDEHRQTLRYVYRTEVPYTEEAHNRTTEGTVHIRLVGRPVKEVFGSYYVERNGSRGTVRFHGRSRKLAGSGKDAEGLNYAELG